MKKQYEAPRLTVVNVLVESLMDNTSIQSVKGNAFNGYGGGSNTEARGREYNDWDD